MNLDNVDGYTLTNLGKINIILGKNGCGKSTLLKKIENSLESKRDIYGVIKYITPERGGVLTYDPGIDNNIVNIPHWMSQTRRTNRFDSFRQQSVAQFRNLEIMFFRELAENESLRTDLSHTFNKYFNKLNSLLDNIEIRSEKATYKIYRKGSNEEIEVGAISSGEAELLSLGMECMVFEKECDLQKLNIIFLDSPDVHLHPDLQVRFSNFLYQLVSNKNIIIILATHSTAFLGALEKYEDTYIEFMLSSQKELNFKKISNEYRQIIPAFGAHPLSNHFNESPIFLVEGEEDCRVWQQAVRSSNGKIKIYPCNVQGKDKMNNYEKSVSQIIGCIYDEPKAYSLRDRDDISDEKDLALEPLGNVKRLRLHCRAAENLLLSREVLESIAKKYEFVLGENKIIPTIDLEDVKNTIKNWLENQIKLGKQHNRYREIEAFFNEIKNDITKIKTIDIKKIRNLLIQFIEDTLNNKKQEILERQLNDDDIISINTDWEILVGQAIAGLVGQAAIIQKCDNSLIAYLGKEVIENIFSIDLWKKYSSNNQF